MSNIQTGTKTVKFVATLLDLAKEMIIQKSQMLKDMGNSKS